MKFKVSAYTVKHTVDLNVEAENKEEALKKAAEVLDTANNLFILAADLNSSSPAVNICTKHLQNIIKASGLGYQFYFGDGLRR